jgi:hypothetical protein
MHGLIRFVGIVNASVWFGAVVFFTIAAGPAFFSAEMASFLPRPHAGRAAEVLISRLANVQIWCAVIALLHLLVEYLFSGRRADQLTLGALAAMLVINLTARFWLLPRMHQLQVIRYSDGATPADKAAAISQFGLWHGLSSFGNLVVIAWLGYYLWLLTRSQPLGRLGSSLR